jgi:hypothetical protein
MAGADAKAIAKTAPASAIACDFSCLLLRPNALRPMVMPHPPSAGTLPDNPDHCGKVPPVAANLKEKVHHLVARRHPGGGDLALWLTKSVGF